MLPTQKTFYFVRIGGANAPFGIHDDEKHHKNNGKTQIHLGWIFRNRWEHKIGYNNIAKKYDDKLFNFIILKFKVDAVVYAMGTAKRRKDAKKQKQTTNKKLFLSQISSVRAYQLCMRRIITKRYQFWFRFCLWILINPRLRLVASRRHPSLVSSVINFINSLTSQLCNYISSESWILTEYVTTTGRRSFWLRSLSADFAA